MEKDHDCVAAARPLIDGSQNGEPILSAAMGDGGVEVYGYCQICDNEVTITYEYGEAEIEEQDPEAGFHNDPNSWSR